MKIAFVVYLGVWVKIEIVIENHVCSIVKFLVHVV